MSDLETVFPDETKDFSTLKLVRLARAYRSRTMLSFRTVYEVNLYGYIETAFSWNSVREATERALMQRKINTLRSGLVQMGIPEERVWSGGIAFSSNRPGQIDMYVRERKPVLLQSYPYFEVPKKENPEAKEQWLDQKGAINLDPLKKEITAEVSLSVKEGSKVPEVVSRTSIKVTVKSNGTLGEISGELKVLEQEIQRRRALGVFTDFKFEVTAIGSVEFEGNAVEGIKKELNAKLKAALSANFFIPRTMVKIPVEVSIGLDIKGKVTPGIQFTLFKW